MKVGRAYWICYVAAVWFLIRAFGNAPSLTGTGAAAVSWGDIFAAVGLLVVGVILHKVAKGQADPPSGDES